MMMAAAKAFFQVMSPAAWPVVVRGSVAMMVALGAAIGLLSLIGGVMSGTGLPGQIAVTLTSALGWLWGAGALVPTAAVLAAPWVFGDCARAADGNQNAPDAPATDVWPVHLTYAALSLSLSLLLGWLSFVPVIGLAAFMAGHSYILGRYYFELAATHVLPRAESERLLAANRYQSFTNGVLITGFAMIPLLQLATPLFAAALSLSHIRMVIAARPTQGRGSVPITRE